MDSTQSTALRDLLQDQKVAALGTLHNGRPFVSMVPLAALPDGTGFVIQVSRLAAHTKDMTSNPQVSLLMMAQPAPHVLPQAIARATIQGQAVQCAESSQVHAAAKAAYLEQFPQSAQMFDLPDFSLFIIHPESVRFVGGFAQATTLSAASLGQILSGG